MRKQVLLIILPGLVIIAAGWWVFQPALHGDWLWDDALYTSAHPLLHDPGRWWKAWFLPGSFIEYYPLDDTVRFIQWDLWQNDTLGYHVTNLVLHLISALLVWRLLRKLGLRLAWLGGLFFAVHPAMVESVAWIAELKNTLSLPPFLLALCFYIDYEEQGRRRDYLLALAFFLVAMLCKITMAPFPVVMLLYAWWKRGRIGWRDLQASAPFFVISLLLGFTTYWCGIWFRQLHLQYSDEVPMGDFLSRVAGAGLSLSFYFFKSLWPVGLMPIYPKWSINPPRPEQFLPWFVILGIIFLSWKKRRSWGRHLLLGLGFFVIMLAPFLGFMPISYMNFTWVMDHFLYLPILGLIGLAIAGLDQVWQRLKPSFRPGLYALILVVMTLLAWESHGYAAKFRNQETLWTCQIQHNPAVWQAHNNLGDAYLQEGRLPEAQEQYEQTLQLNPACSGARTNLGTTLLEKGEIPEAIAQYQQAIAIDPNSAGAHYNLGTALAQLGRYAEAMEQFAQTLRLDPDNAAVHNNLGRCLLQLGRIPEAKAECEEALRLDPALTAARFNLAQLEQLQNAPGNENK